jgi:lysyl-tRNA synthetase class 2
VLPAIVCAFKGKIGMGLVGLVVPVVSLVGAWRPARPGSMWDGRFGTRAS